MDPEPKEVDEVAHRSELVEVLPHELSHTGSAHGAKEAQGNGHIQLDLPSSSDRGKSGSEGDSDWTASADKRPDPPASDQNDMSSAAHEPPEIPLQEADHEHEHEHEAEHEQADHFYSVERGAVTNENGDQINGQSSPGAKEILDFQGVREHWEEEAKKKTPSGVTPSAFDDPKTPSHGNLISAFDDRKLAVGSDDTSTDNLSGISDPIADLTQSPRKSGTVAKQASPRIAETPSSSGPTSSRESRSIPEECLHDIETSHALDARGSETSEGKGDDVGKRREKQPTSAQSSPDETANFADYGTSIKYAKEKWEESLPSPNTAAASPASANMFSDESSIVHPDADHIVMLENTDMRPCFAEPELDGEPVFAYDHGGDDDENETHGSLTDEGSPYTLLEGKVHELERARPADYPRPLQDEVSINTAHVAETLADTRLDEHLREGSSMRSLQSLPSDIPPDASPLPDATPVLSSGSILTRSSFRSLVMKKWHPNYWVRYGPTSVFIFRSEDDFNDWLQNPYHTKKQREFLIKLRLDFYNDMMKTNIRGFKMTDIKVKTYEKKDGPTYNFKLERWSDLGVSIIAAFGSPDVKEVKAVHDAINRCLEMCPNNGLKPIDDLVVTKDKI